MRNRVLINPNIPLILSCMTKWEIKWSALIMIQPANHVFPTKGLQNGSINTIIAETSPKKHIMERMTSLAYTNLDMLRRYSVMIRKTTRWAWPASDWMGNLAFLQ